MSILPAEILAKVLILPCCLPIAEREREREREREGRGIHAFSKCIRAKVKRTQPRSGFELSLPSPFTLTITLLPRPFDTRVYIYPNIPLCIMQHEINFQAMYHWSAFSIPSPRLVALPWLNNLVLPCYLPIAEERRDGFMLFNNLLREVP